MITRLHPYRWRVALSISIVAIIGWALSPPNPAEAQGDSDVVMQIQDLKNTVNEVREDYSSIQQVLDTLDDRLMYLEDEKSLGLLPPPA